MDAKNLIEFGPFQSYPISMSLSISDGDMVEYTL